MTHALKLSPSFLAYLTESELGSAQPIRREICVWAQCVRGSSQNITGYTLVCFNPKRVVSGDEPQLLSYRQNAKKTILESSNSESYSSSRLRRFAMHILSSYPLFQNWLERPASAKN